MNKRRVTFFLPNLHGGGAERVAVNLLKGMSAKDIPLDLVLADAEGPYPSQVPQQVRVINLAAGRALKAILPLSNYLREVKPCTLFSHLSHANVVAVAAKLVARTKTRLVLVDHTPAVAKSQLMRGRFVPMFMRWLYPHADVLVGVSEGTARDIETQTGIANGKVKVIYNPVVDEALLEKAKAPLEHPWFQVDSPKVILSVGRLTEPKDFFTLIKAFEILRRQRPLRLIILGEGEDRRQLEATIAKLGISEDVFMPGFVENPYAYMSRASALVLSSQWEALPTVLIEAMACGCPVVATDCPTGPREILDAGVYGPLVPVGDAVALSAAMLQVLENPPSQELLIKRSMYFSFERIVPEYLELLVNQ